MFVSIVLVVTQNLLNVDDLRAGIPCYTSTHEIPVLTFFGGFLLEPLAKIVIISEITKEMRKNSILVHSNGESRRVRLSHSRWKKRGWSQLGTSARLTLCDKSSRNIFFSRRAVPSS